MTNDELKKKIVDVLIKVDEYVRNEIIKATEEHKAFLTGDNQYYYIVADALIAAGIGDVKETEHRAVVAELVVKNLNDICTFDYQTVFEQAEKELEEEGKE